MHAKFLKTAASSGSFNVFIPSNHSPAFALQGLAFVTLKAEVLLPSLTVHIKQNTIRQLGEDKGHNI